MRSSSCRGNMSEKYSKWNKKCAREQKMCKGTKNVPKGFCGTLWYWIALYGLVWPCMPLYGLVWPHMVLLLLFMAIAVCCLIQLSMALWLCDLSWSWRAFLWSYMAFWGFIWHFMVFSGNISSLFAVIDLNSFGLVYYWFNGNCHHSWYIHKQCTKNSANLLTFIPIYLINE